MPIPRIKLTFIANDDTRLGQMRDVIENNLPPVSKIRRRVHDWDFDWDRGQRYAVLDIEFHDVADALAVWNSASAANAITFLSARGRGVVSAHLCYHKEDPTISCRYDPRAQYREVSFGS